MTSVTVFRSNKLKNIISIFIGVLLISIGIHHSSYLVTTLFSFCLLVSVVDLLPNSSYLKLSKKGFEFSSFFRTTFVSWSEVNHFSAIFVSHKKVVGWNYLNIEQVNPKKLRKLTSGMDGALPERYGLKAESLVKIMNEHKLRNV